MSPAAAPAPATPQAARTPAGQARERIQATAFRLFYAYGLRAAGIDTIIAESGVAKATFYKYFPAKDDLNLAYLEQVDGVWSGQLHAAAEAAGPDPAAQLVGLFDALSTACRRDGYRGCAFINAAAESASGTRVHERTVTHKQEVLAWIRDLADRAGARDPEGLARSPTLLLDAGMATGEPDADPAAAAAAQLVAAALTNPSTPNGQTVVVVLSPQNDNKCELVGLIPAEVPLTAAPSPVDPQLARWQRFRKNRNEA